MNKSEPKMRTYVFKVVVEPDEDQWHAYCPVLEDKGGATWGYTKEEALENISEVVEMIIEETLKTMIERQAKWTEQDLKRLKILK